MWIVLGEEKGKIKLVSSTKEKGLTRPGLLPKGSFLTIENNGNKHVLRVVDSQQHEPYSPSPMLIDMDLSSLRPDQKCQNIVYACRVADLNERKDGYIDFIQPQLIARRSNQQEIDAALGLRHEGPAVFLATFQASKCQILRDDSGNPIKVSIPPEVFFHQILICGKTGSGKTVASKYLAQYFVEEMDGFGAVLAVNVKDVDLLRMDQPSVTSNPSLKEEWESLGKSAHGIDNFTIYYPANTTIDRGQGVNLDLCKPITLDVQTLDPEALSGLLVGVSGVGGQYLPGIFRKWQQLRKDEKRRKPSTDFSFKDFVAYFTRQPDEDYIYETMNIRGDTTTVTLPWSTYHNIMRNLTYAMEFFDNEEAIAIDADDVLIPGKMSVINVTGEKGPSFGAVLLRHLLKSIVELKKTNKNEVPILIIIDEVHQFYDTESSRETLGDLDTICRTGRSKNIGVIFSSQTPSDMPKGISTVVNSKIFFKSDRSMARDYDIGVDLEEMQSLGKGYALVNIHGLPQIKILKFPLAMAGVFEKEGRDQ